MNTQKLKNLLKDPRTNWKYIIIVAILTFIAGAVIMNYLSKTGFEIPQIILPKRIDETADWKTYANTDLGYAIDYPKGWIVQDYGVDLETELLLNPEPEIDAEIAPASPEYERCVYPAMPMSYIHIRTHIGGPTLNQHRDRLKSHIGGQSLFEGEIGLAGQKAYFYTSSDYPQCPGETKALNLFREILLEHEERVYELWTQNYQLLEVQNALNSFRFLGL